MDILLNATRKTVQKVLVSLHVALLAGLIVLPVSVGESAQKGATLIGNVSFHGVIPPSATFQVQEDVEYCGKTVSIQTVQVQPGSKRLRQAVVSIEGIKERPITRKNTSVLINQDCTFRPRINTGMLHDTFEIRNMDPILHNTHGVLGQRTLVNVAQVPGGRPIMKEIKYPGIMKIQCDKHEFMKGYLLMFTHPHFAITDSTGHFQISGLPEGTHRVLVWHESLGYLEKDVKIPKHGIVNVEFAYP